MVEPNAQDDKLVKINENLLDDLNVYHSTDDYFDAIFDILDDDDGRSGADDNNKTAEELENINEEYYQNYDFDYINTNVDEEEMMPEDDTIVDDNDDNKKVEEQVLSQKLSQLSPFDEYYYFDADDDEDDYSNDQNNQGEEQLDSVSCNKKRQLSTPSTPDVTAKKIRPPNDEEDDQNQQKNDLPHYLQSTNDFSKKLSIHHLTNPSWTTNTVEDLRQLAILQHKMADIYFQKELYEIYLKAGKGQWETEESGQTMVDRCMWPVHINKMIHHRTEDEQKRCEILVHEYLAKFNQTIEQYQNEFDQKKNSLKDLTDDNLITTIQTLVQQYSIRPLQMMFNYKKTILECNYDSEILEREFLRLKPNEYQKQLARRLYELRSNYSESREKLIELKQRILCNKPTISMYPALLSSVSTAMLDLLNYDKADRQKYQRDMQEKLTDSMIASIIDTEDKIHEYQELFDEEMLHLSTYNKSNNNGDDVWTQLIHRRLKIIDKKLHSKYTFRIHYYVRSHCGDLEEKANQSPIGFLPSLIIHDPSLVHPLTDEQCKLLNRGPTYIAPCQMYLSTKESMKDMIEKQYTVLQHHLSIFYAKLHLNPSQSMFISKEIKEAYTDIFSIRLSPSLHQRALYERRLIQSIRQQLKTNHLILRRTANQRNIFYLGNMKDFQDKAREYVNNTDIFEFSQTIDQNNLRPIQEYLAEIIQTMNSEFETLLKNNKFHQDLLKKLYIDIGKIQLPYLYFLPDVSIKNNSLSLKPVIAGSQRSITTRLGYFLDKLLRPIFQFHARTTRYVHGGDFMRKFIEYAEEQQHLCPTTNFATIKILNFNTLVPHGIMLITLEDFLKRDLAMPTIENISINRIIHLTSIFLHNNRFYYDQKIYRFIKGGPHCFPLIETLSNIYVYQWERGLISELSIRNEFYARCKDQIFFTWNKTADELRQLLQTTMATRDRNFEIDVKIDFKGQFLGAHLQNLSGTLFSSVYHDPDIPKYTLPYVIGDSKAEHSHWLRSALIRAVRYCTSVYDFNHEQIRLEITCLANGYSLEFIEQRIQHFFLHFDALSLRSSLDQNVYEKLRHRLFNFLTEQQHYFLKQNQELEKNNQRIQMTYLYQLGPKYKFNKKLKEILSNHLYPPSRASSALSVPKSKQVKIILKTKQQYSLNAQLSEQKPSHRLLSQKIMTF